MFQHSFWTRLCIVMTLPMLSCRVASCPSGQEEIDGICQPCTSKLGIFADFGEIGAEMQIFPEDCSDFRQKGIEINGFDKDSVDKDLRITEVGLGIRGNVDTGIDNEELLEIRFFEKGGLRPARAQNIQYYMRNAVDVDEDLVGGEFRAEAYDVTDKLLAMADLSVLDGVPTGTELGTKIALSALLGGPSVHLLRIRADLDAHILRALEYSLECFERPSSPEESSIPEPVCFGESE